MYSQTCTVPLDYYLSSNDYSSLRKKISRKREQQKFANRHSTSYILSLSSKHLDAVFQTKKLDSSNSILVVSNRLAISRSVGPIRKRGEKEGVIESTCERGERKKGKKKEKFRRTLLVSRPRSVNGRSSLRSRDYRLIAAKRGSLFCRDVTSSPCRRHRRPLPLFPCFHLSARPLLFPEFELTPRFLLRSPLSFSSLPFSLKKRI